jgi:hypothetical protein
MKHNIIFRFAFVAILLFAGITAMAQTNNNTTSKKEPAMKTYLIERGIPGASQLTANDLKGISQKSCGVLKEMGPKIKWMHSYVAGNKIYCVYQAQNEGLLREHAQKGGFPITTITEIASTISPATAEQ